MLLIATLTSTATTHLKEKNRILHKQEKLLMEAEKEKLRANLLRAISHDLRTPLTSIIGNSAAYLDNDKTLSRRDKHLLIQNIYDDSKMCIRDSSRPDLFLSLWIYVWGCRSGAMPLNRRIYSL